MYSPTGLTTWGVNPSSCTTVFGQIGRHFGGMDKIRSDKAQTYVVEHLDPELGPWSALEYQAITQESASAGLNFCLSSVPRELELPSELRAICNLVIEHQSVEDIFKDDKERICLLDPAAKTELSPEDAAKFDVFLFGGILGRGLG